MSGELACTYAQFESMRREVLSFGGAVEETDYGADVVLSVLLPEERTEEFAARVLDLTAGTAELLLGEARLLDVPCQPPQ